MTKKMCFVVTMAPLSVPKTQGNTWVFFGFSVDITMEMRFGVETTRHRFLLSSKNSLEKDV